jgi:hypothetical protein
VPPENESANSANRAAAWDLCIELLTRVATQALPASGDEGATLDDLYGLFPIARAILRKHGSVAPEFAGLAIPMLIRVLRPFIVKWHRLSLAHAFENPSLCREFRTELADVQSQLRTCIRALAALAAMQSLTGIN